jgi:hypothetical protein
MTIRCLFFGHKYVTTQKLSPTSRRIACTRCRRMFGMNDEVRAVIDWSGELHKMYERFGHEIKYLPWEGAKP